MSIKILVFAVAIVSLVLVSVACSSMGSSPSKRDKENFYSSKHYNKEKGVFQNRRPKYMKEAEKKLKIWPVMKKMFFEKGDTVPSKKLAEVKPDIQEFLNNPNELKTIWLGHSTFLLNMNGTIILVDPVFSQAASPVSFLIKRFQKPVLKLKGLPKIDYVVISHDHYDHLDMKSIKHFRKADTKFLTPLGVGAHLEGWGIPRDRIIEKDWWESEELGGVKFVATPAQHFSGRGFSDKNHTLWASWVIQSKDHSVYFSGDSGYDIHFKEIGEKYGPFDVAFIESGQYNKMWEQVHLLPEKFVQAFKDVKAKSYFPVHWGMFKLSIHAWNEPIKHLYEMSKQENFVLHAPKIGEILNVKQPSELEPWWVNPVVAVTEQPQNFSVVSLKNN